MPSKFRPPFKGDADTKLSLGDKEVFILVREDCTVEVYSKLGQLITESQLLGIGIGWALENEEWKQALIKKSHARMKSIVDEVNAEKRETSP